MVRTPAAGSSAARRTTPRMMTLRVVVPFLPGCAASWHHARRQLNYRPNVDTPLVSKFSTRGRPHPGHARVWAPACRQSSLSGKWADFSLRPKAADTTSAAVDGIEPGTTYRFRLNGGEFFPDPASRYQPEGPHGPSVVVDPGAYDWGDGAWRGCHTGSGPLRAARRHVHGPGTFRGAIERLPDLVDIGVTVIELMPIADFPGKFGWGYDGVNLFAPCRLYGTPDDMRAFVDAAHGLELGVILDVVYNHFGPDGNYLTRYRAAVFQRTADRMGRRDQLRRRRRRAGS